MISAYCRRFEKYQKHIDIANEIEQSKKREERYNDQ
jgi:hypothetical protein